MKTKYLNLWLLFITIIIASCSKKDETNYGYKNNVSLSMVEKVLNTKNAITQKSLYMALNSQEKSALWAMKFDGLLKKNNYSKDQSSYILKVKALINKELFEENQNASKDNFYKIEPFLREEGNALFGNNRATSIMASLSPDDTIEPILPQCGCTVKSDYCPKKQPFGWPFGVPFKETSCVSGNCDINFGCGTLLVFWCTGNCETKKD